MKKLILSFVLLVMAAILIACDGTVVKTPVVISKVYTTTRQANNVIELYNTAEEDIDLAGYALNFYTNGSKEISQTIDLSGTIQAKAYFAIGGNGNNAAGVDAKLDFKHSASLPFNGNDAIVLSKSGQPMDVFGTIGSDFDFSKNLTMIRLGEKDSYQPTTQFDLFSFIGYLPDVWQYLKNDDHEIQTFEQIYDGPRLEARYLDMPYVDPNNSNLGNGGAVTTTVTSIADGDTATFAQSGGFPGGNSMRYYYINTPEVNGSYVVAEPWGYVASKYNKEYILKNSSSKLIQVQSIPGIALREVNGRNLGLVWINGHLSQFLTVREGLSDDVSPTYEAYDYLLTYKNVPILTFLRFAENEAKKNGWGTKGFPGNPDGEKSPDWNYQANNGAGKNSTENPVWEPHLPMPW